MSRMFNKILWRMLASTKVKDAKKSTVNAGKTLEILLYLNEQQFNFSLTLQFPVGPKRHI